MPTDWLFYWMMQPTGLLLIGLAVFIPFILWRFALGHAFPGVGFTPLLVAYACAALGLLVVNFTWSYLEFSERVTNGLLSEAQRWPIVAGWTLYTAVLSLIVVLPLLGIVGVPLSALLIRMRRLTYLNIAMTIMALWLALTLMAWGYPSNEWDRTHRLESLITWLKTLLPGIALIAGPFLLGIHQASRSSRHGGTSGQRPPPPYSDPR